MILNKKIITLLLITGVIIGFVYSYFQEDINNLFKKINSIMYSNFCNLNFNGEKHFDKLINVKFSPNSKNFGILTKMINLTLDKKEYANYTISSLGELSLQLTLKGYEDFIYLVNALQFSDIIITYSEIIDKTIQKEPSIFTNINVCYEDRDCIKVQQGCCPCNSGGSMVAVNRKYYDFYNLNLKNNCKNNQICLAYLNPCDEISKCKEDYVSISFLNFTIKTCQLVDINTIIEVPI